MTEMGYSDYVQALGRTARNYDLSANASRMGAKAWRLDELIARGVLAPPSVCLLTCAFERYLAVNGATERHRQIASNLPSERARRELVDLAYAYEIPSALRLALDAVLAEVVSPQGDRPLLAVRSSAVDEDGAHASFAGQYVSRLGVVPRAVWPAIRDCWASAWSAQAVDYRARARSADHTAGMAVLIQPMVDAEVSAVAFTRDPRGEEEDHIVVNAAWGLGEGIVTGGVSADVYHVTRGALRVCASHVGEKASKVVLSPAGGTERVQTISTELCLKPDAVLPLARVALEIEALLGSPADIEAAFVDHTWRVLQGRPITTLVSHAHDPAASRIGVS